MPAVELNKCTKTGTSAVIQSEGITKHRVLCPATGEATDWADTIPQAANAWNRAHPAPEAPIPTIPILPEDKV